MFGRNQPCNLTATGAMFLRITRVMLWVLAVAFVGFWIAAATYWAGAVHVTAWRDWAAPIASLVPLGAGLGIVLVGLFAASASFIAAARSGLFDRPNRAAIRGRAMTTGVVLFAAAVGLVYALHRGLAVPWMAWSGWRLVVALAAIAAMAMGVNALRKGIVQYVGDVAIYVSAHTVSRFAKIREAIQGTGRSLARDVFGAYDLKTGALVYDEVVMVGHSLGSVIAYDMLNDSIQRDLELANRLRKWSNVIGRTKLLLTAGSPLDKTAFLFRTQADALATREALAAAAQPMIRDYGLRPANWVNIWSPWDWISGSLQYYDDLTLSPSDSRAVINKVDADAPLFVASAHTGYWERPLMREHVYDAVWS
jgi:hypothetical protein